MLAANLRQKDSFYRLSAPPTVGGQGEGFPGSEDAALIAAPRQAPMPASLVTPSSFADIQSFHTFPRNATDIAASELQQRESGGKREKEEEDNGMPRITTPTPAQRQSGQRRNPRAGE